MVVCDNCGADKPVEVSFPDDSGTVMYHFCSESCKDKWAKKIHD